MKLCEAVTLMQNGLDHILSSRGDKRLPGLSASHPVLFRLSLVFHQKILRYTMVSMVCGCILGGKPGEFCEFCGFYHSIPVVVR